MHAYAHTSVPHVVNPQSRQSLESPRGPSTHRAATSAPSTGMLARCLGVTALCTWHSRIRHLEELLSRLRVLGPSDHCTWAQPTWGAREQGNVCEGKKIRRTLGNAEDEHKAGDAEGFQGLIIAGSISASLSQAHPGHSTRAREGSLVGCPPNMYIHGVHTTHQHVHGHMHKYV